MGRFKRMGLALLAAMLTFVLGAVGTLFVLMRVFAPGGDCQSPCDAPVYVALGAGIFIAPVVGVICGGLVYALVVRGKTRD